MMRLIPARVRTRAAFFDLWSTVYDVGWAQRLVYRPVHDAVLAELRRSRSRRILDVGCGTGLLTTRIARELPGSRAVGYDLSRGMLAQARRRAPRGLWVRGDAQALSFADASFDMLVSTESFHWLPDPEAALREFHRVLAPGGRLLVALVNPPVAAVGSLARQLSGWLGQPFEWPTPGRMARRVEAAGLRVETQRRVDARPLRWILPAMLTVAVRPT